MDGGAWRATVHGAAESQTRLSDFTFTFSHVHMMPSKYVYNSKWIKGIFASGYKVTPVGSDSKESAAMQETRVRSLGWKHPLEEGMATHSGILAREMPWTEGPGGLWSVESQSQM